jgi:hypothetical protein
MIDYNWQVCPSPADPSSNLANSRHALFTIHQSPAKRCDNLPISRLSCSNLGKVRSKLVQNLATASQASLKQASFRQLLA